MAGTGSGSMSGLLEILEDGFMGNLPNPTTLQAISKLSDQQTAAYCFISPETYRRWKHDRKPPNSALRLLSLRAGYCPWPGWERYFYCQHDGLIYHRDLKYGFRPGDLPRLYWLEREIDSLRRELEGATKEVKQARDRILQLGDTLTLLSTLLVSHSLPNEGQKNTINSGSQGRNAGDNRFRVTYYYIRQAQGRRAHARPVSRSLTVENTATEAGHITGSYKNSIHYAQ